MRRFKEVFKNIILTCLIISASCLLFITWVYGLDFDRIPTDSILYSIMQALDLTHNKGDWDQEEVPAAYPIKFAVRNQGEFYSVKYNEGIISSNMSTTKDVIATALNTASKLQKTSYDRYSAALLNDVLFVEYEGLIPVNLIADWFGAQTKLDETDVGVLAISRMSQNKYSLFLRNRNSNVIYETTTEVTDELFYAGMDTFVGNATSFACEDVKYNKLYCDTLIQPTSTSYDIIEARTPTFGDNGGNESKQAILEAFKYNPYTAKSYYDEDEGQMVYIENYSTLKISSKGRITFQASDISGGLEAYRTIDVKEERIDSKRVDLARSILQKTVMAIGNANSVYLQQYYKDNSTDTYIAIFAPIYNGVPIAFEGNNHFARFEFKGNVMTNAVINLRQYKSSGEQLYVLKESQVADSLRTLNEIFIGYIDHREDRIVPIWKLYMRDKYAVE